MARDWRIWNSEYDDPDSPLSRRLAIVQSWLREALAARGSSQTALISLCSGLGRDVIDVLAENGFSVPVKARLVDNDPECVERCKERIERAALRGVEVLQDDAACIETWLGAVPADIVMACGIFGNVALEDVFHTIDCLPQLCNANAIVLWTRSRRAPDVTTVIRQYFISRRFRELKFEAPKEALFSVGMNMFEGRPLMPNHGERLFSFLT